MTYQSSAPRSTKNNHGFDLDDYDEPNDNSDLDLDYSTDGSDLEGDNEHNGVPEESQPRQSPATPLHQAAPPGLLDSDGVQDVPVKNGLQSTRGANESVSFSSQSNTLHNQSGYSKNEIEERKKKTTETLPSESITLADVRSELVTSDQSALTKEEASDPTRVRLKTILLKSNLQGAMTAFDNHGVSDIWLPIPKQLLRHFFSDNQDTRSFSDVQNQSLDRNPDHLNIQHTGLKAGIYHASFEDGDDIIHGQRDLGDGGFGTVEEVSVPTDSGPVICVRKTIERPRQLKAQKQLMTAFAREINVMRQVDHPHCVRILGSYTDFESVNILLRPVADTDLAKFLDRPLGDTEKKNLYKGIHCLCSALNYLHQTKIRHEDLKPQNVLILGENLLLTDFGFSLDFSDDSVSTTKGLPKALTVRYSAPEVLEFEPRNRASDIFSLGCVLYEMISAIDGHSLTEVKGHWKRSGDGESSFARNPAAASVYLEPLPSSFNPKDLPYLREYTQFMLNSDRDLRPSAQQVVDRVSELGSFLGEMSLDFRCCDAPWPPSPYGSHRYPQFDANYCFYPHRQNGFGYILLDLQFNKIASTPTYYHTGLFADFPKIRRTSQALYQKADIERRNPELWNAHTIWKERHGDLTDAELHVETSARILSLKHVELYRDMDFVCIPLETDSSKLSPPVHQRYIWISLVPVSLPRSPYYGAFFYMLSFQL